MMKIVDPTYFLVATPEDTGELEEFLLESKIAWRPNPADTFTESLMEFAGRLCYNSWVDEKGTYSNENLTSVRSGNKDYLANLIRQGHLSIFEHCGPLTFLFKDVSRVFTHELVRHRIGCSYSQTSGRYVRESELKISVPQCLDQQGQDTFKIAAEFAEKAIKELSSLHDWDEMTFHQKKQITSALRRLAPTGQANNILMSCNHRAVREIIRQRTSIGAEVEIREMFINVALDLRDRFPNIYQDMIQTDDGEIHFGY